jgi:acyl carrier protein
VKRRVSVIRSCQLPNGANRERKFIMKEKVLAILTNLIPTIDFAHETKLVDDKLIDSLMIINIISELSIAFDIDINFDQITSDNLNSAEAMVAMIERLKP